MSKLVKWTLVILLQVAITLIALYIASSDKFGTMATKSERLIIPSQELKLYNSSLGHIWVKEGVKVVKLIDCDKECTDRVRKRD